MQRTEILCPVDGCDWVVDATLPEVGDEALARVFGPGTMASVAALQHNHKIEGELKRHLQGHTTLEWAHTATRLRHERDVAQARNDELKALLADVRRATGQDAPGACEPPPR